MYRRVRLFVSGVFVCVQVGGASAGRGWGIGGGVLHRRRFPLFILSKADVVVLGARDGRV